MNTSPKTAIILGTGLGQLASEITDTYEFAYQDIPNFPVSTVEGHSGKLIFGKLGGVDILAMKGRFHFYEGYSMKEVTFPVRVMYELGVKTLFVSNAAGGMNPEFKIGDLMVITDHINFFPEHPLRGKNLPTGPRFPDMHEPYDPMLIKLADDIARRESIPVKHGVYVGVPSRISDVSHPGRRCRRYVHRPRGHCSPPLWHPHLRCLRDYRPGRL